MLNHAVQFEFVGFNPDYEIRSIISSIADRIHNLAPSDSFMRVAMKRGRNAIEASCKIASSTGVFVAETICNTPIEAIGLLETKIMSQLDSWKQHRFAV